MTFTVPRDGEIFIEQVLDRCKSLIASGIWEGVSPVRLDTWMKNYRTGEERYFGACVLDSLIFRSEKQTIALMRQMFDRTLPDLVRRWPHPTWNNPTTTWMDLLCGQITGVDPLIRLVPVIGANDSPAKSGPSLARLYRRHLSLNQYWMIWPWQIENAKRAGIRTFLFIDDFLGTGDQFMDFAAQFNLVAALKGCYAVYCPLVAHATGARRLTTEIPDLKVVAVESIDNSYSLFCDSAPWFSDGVNTPQIARAFYDDFTSRHRFPVKADAWRGYGKLSLAYAFSHATPDNCLPIIWAEAATWNSLLER